MPQGQECWSSISFIYNFFCFRYNQARADSVIVCVCVALDTVIKRRVSLSLSLLDLPPDGINLAGPLRGKLRRPFESLPGALSSLP